MKSKITFILNNLKKAINNIYSYIKKILNKKYFHQKLSNILLILISITLLATLFIYRQNILFTVGNKFFGGKIGTQKYNTTLYDIDWAETFYSLADDSDNKKVMWLNYQLSRIHFIRGNLDVAIKYADKELEIHPTNCRTHYIRGLAYAYMDTEKSLDKAISDFETFNKCFPGTWAGHNDLAWFWFRKGNMEKVIEVAEEVTGKYPDNPWIQNTYGTALMNVGRLAEAKKAFEAAKKSADVMTQSDWGIAYPGNDPSIYSKGLDAMRKSINENLKILNEGIKNNPL